MRREGEHRWKLAWPGNYCLDCGLDDPLEGPDALVDCDCAAGCDRCGGTGCKINPNLVVPPCPASLPPPPRKNVILMDLKDPACHADHCPGPHQGMDKLKPSWYLRLMLTITKLSASMGPEVLVVTKAVLHIVCHLFNLPHPEGIL